MGREVSDIEATVRELRQRGVTFEEYGLPGLKTVNSVARIEGNYPSKAGAAEKGRGSETMKAIFWPSGKPFLERDSGPLHVAMAACLLRYGRKKGDRPVAPF